MDLPGYDAWKLATPPYLDITEAEEAEMEARRPTAEDWENACHEIIWTVDPELFERVRQQADRERDDREARAAARPPYRPAETVDEEPF